MKGKSLTGRILVFIRGLMKKDNGIADATGNGICWHETLEGVFIPKLNAVLDGRDSRYRSSQMTWRSAMAKAQKHRKRLPTLKEYSVICRHLNEINAVLRKHGGESLVLWHWTAEEEGHDYAWLVDAGRTPPLRIIANRSLKYRARLISDL